MYRLYIERKTNLKEKKHSEKKSGAGRLKWKPKPKLKPYDVASE